MKACNQCSTWNLFSQAELGTAQRSQGCWTQFGLYAESFIKMYEEE